MKLKKTESLERHSRKLSWCMFPNSLPVFSTAEEFITSLEDNAEKLEHAWFFINHVVLWVM